MGIEERALAFARLALDQREGQIPAEDHAAGGGEAVGKALRDRADPGNRHDAERDAGNEDAEAAQATAQFAPSEAQRHETALFGDRREHQAAFGMMRARAKCVGAKITSGIPINMPPNHTLGGIQACAA